MKNLKRIDEDTILIDGVYYSQNSLKKVEIQIESVYELESVKLKRILYYQYKKNKNY